MVNGQAGSWIRPISAREHHEISALERLYPDRRDPAVLDVIDVPLIEPRPHLFQQENWLLNPKAGWEKAGHLDAAAVGRLGDCAPRLTPRAVSMGKKRSAQTLWLAPTASILRRNLTLTVRCITFPPF
jgi:hypothetical protein